MVQIPLLKRDWMIPENAKYYFFGFAATGRADFAVIYDEGNGAGEQVAMFSLDIVEVYKKLISKNIQAVNLAKGGLPPPEGFPKKRW